MEHAQFAKAIAGLNKPAKHGMGALMVTVLADNQLMAAAQPTDTTISTDPVPMGGADRASGVLTVHYNFGAAGAIQTLSVYLEGSDDGTNWVDANSGAPWEVSTAVGSIILTATEAVFAFVRLKFKLGVAGGSVGDLGFVCFDARCILDKS